MCQMAAAIRIKAINPVYFYAYDQLTIVNKWYKQRRKNHASPNKCATELYNFHI